MLAKNRFFRRLVERLTSKIDEYVLLVWLIELIEGETGLN